MADNDPGLLKQVPQHTYDPHKEGGVTDHTGSIEAPVMSNLLLDSAATSRTGEPINPALADYLRINGPSLNPLQSTIFTNQSVAERYSNNSFGGYNPYDLNMENWYGEKQGWFTQMGNRLAKFGVKSVGSFANGLMDMPNTLNALANSSADKFWDNPVNNWVNDLMERAEKAFPNYKTNWESEHPFLNLIPFYGNAGNGWGNVLEQTGFTVGALASSLLVDAGIAALTGGIGEIPLVAAQLNKIIYGLGKTLRVGDNALDALKTTIKSSDDIIKGLRGIDRFNYAARKGIWGANMITSGMSEAAFEGIESYKTLSKDLEAEFIEKNGRLPNYEELQKINNTARDAGNTRFLMNTGLLAVTNTIQWGSLLRPFNATKELLESEIKSGIKVGLKDGVFELVEPTSRFTKLVNKVKNSAPVTMFVNSSSEGFEEGAQFWIQNGVDSFYKRKYDDNAIDFTNNFTKSFGDGLSKTLGTQEGWENIVYGLLGGGVFKAGEAIYNKSKGNNTPNYKQQLEAVIRGLNSQSLTGIFENKYGETVTAASIEKDLQQAAKQGNLFQYKNFKHEQFANFIISGLKQNKFDVRLEQLEDLKSLGAEEFEKTFGIPSSGENRKNISSLVDKMKDNASFIKEVHDRVTRTFINPYKLSSVGNYKNKKNAEDELESSNNYMAYEAVKDQLVYNMSVSKDSGDRISQLKNEISNIDGRIDVDTVLKVSSEEGLKTLSKELNEKVKSLEDSLKLVKDPKVQKEINWTLQRIEEINDILEEKNDKEQNTKRGKFVEKIFGKEIENSTDKKPFDSLKAVEMLNLGNDISLLDYRNKVAIDRYASLTTKGGFKKLFDSAIVERKKAVEKSVKIDEEIKKDEALDILGLNKTNDGIAATMQPNTQEIDNAAGTLRLNKIVVDVLDGKIVGSEFDLEQLGFRILPDIQLDDPNADVKDYAHVKSKAGMDYYMPNDMAKAAREIVKKADDEKKPSEKSQEEKPPSDSVNPPIPPSKNAVEGSSMFVENLISHIFVPNDLRAAFNNAIFSGTKDEVRQDLSISVKVLDKWWQDQHDAQKKNASYSPYTGFPGVFVARAPIDLSILHKGIEIGKLSYPERMLFKVGNVFVNMDKLTPEQYENFTKRPAAQYAADLQVYNAQVSFKNYLAMRFRENNLNPVTLSPKELSELLDISIAYGELDKVVTDKERPLYTELKHNQITFKDKEGNTHNTMAIISVPKQYVEDIGYTRTELINIIYGKNYFDGGRPRTNLSDYVRNNHETILSVNSRYIGIIEKPDGVYQPVALRAATMSDEAREDLFKSLKERAIESTKNMVRVDTKEESQGTILVGNTEVYYKLINDEAKSFNDQFNIELDSKVFISDVNGSLKIDLSLSPIGSVRIEIYNPSNKYRSTLFVSSVKMQTINNFKDFEKAIISEIGKKNAKDKLFADLKVQITADNFKQNIADDQKQGLFAEDVAPLLSAATTIEVTKNASMSLIPNTGEVNKAYDKIKPKVKKEPVPDVTAPQSDIEAQKADIERRREEELAIFDKVKNAKNKQELIDASKEWLDLNPYDTKQVHFSIASNLMTPGSFERGKELLIEEYKSTENTRVKVINAKYDAELAALGEAPAAERIIEDTINPNPVASQVGMFGGIAVNVSEEGEPFYEDLTRLEAQEDLSQIEFDSVKDALSSKDIAYTINPDGSVQYFEISSKQELPDLKDAIPVDLAKQLGLKIKPQEREDDVAFKVIQNGNEVKNIINIQKAKTYIEATLPDFIQLEDVDSLINKISVNGEVYGAFSNGIIYLNKNAESGTEYHETFHAVFRTLLTDEQINTYLKAGQSILYKQLAAQKKSIRTLLKEKRSQGLYANLSDETAYDRLYEETIADSFQEWKAKKAPVGILGRLFELLSNLFNWIFRNKTDLDLLFRKIDSGKYKYSNIVANRFTQSIDDETGLPEFAFSVIPARPRVTQVAKATIVVKRNVDPKTAKQVVQNVAVYFSMYRDRKEFDKFSNEQLLDKILDDLRNTYNSGNPLYAAWTQEQKSILEVSDESYIYTNEESRNVIKEGAKKYINSINYIEQFEEEEADEDETGKSNQPATGFDNTSENKGGFSSLPKRLREYIGFTSYVKEKDQFGISTLGNGMPIIATVDSLSVYYGLLRSLANVTDPVKFFQKMVKYANPNNEQTMHFVEKFIADSGLDTKVLLEENRLVATKNTALVEMVKKGFNKYRIDYLFTAYFTNTGETRSFHPNRRNVESVQFSDWSNNFINKYVRYDNDTQRKIKNRLNDVLNESFDPRVKIKYDDNSINEASKEITGVLREIGIQLSPDFVKYSLLSSKVAEFDELNEKYKKEGAELQFTDPHNTIITKDHYQYVQIMKIPGETALNRDFILELNKALVGNNNPFFKSIVVDKISNKEIELDTDMSSRLLNVARGNALFDETVGESSYTNAANKLVFAHQDGTFNVKTSYGLRDANTRRKLRETGIREDITGYRDEYDKEWLTLNPLLNSKQFEAIADNLLFRRVDGLRATEVNSFGKIVTQEFRDQKEGVTYGDFSPREFIVNMINLYISGSVSQRTSQGTVITTPHLIRVLEASKTGDMVNLPINLDVYSGNTVTKKTIDRVYDEFTKEFRRIQIVKEQIGKLKFGVVENYHTGSFLKDDQGNDTFEIDKGYRGLQFTDNITSLLSNATTKLMERKARTGEIISNEDIALIKSDIASNLNNMVDGALEIMNREGIVSKDSTGSYTNKLLYEGVSRDSNDLNFNKSMGFVSGNDLLHLKRVRKPADFKDNIGHVVINDYLNTLAYNQILHGDSALSLKNDGGIDAVKRAKGDNAAITSMRTDLINPSLGITEPFTHSNIAIFKEPKVWSDVIKGFIDVADAQMYTTVKGLRYTLWGLGRLSNRVANVLDALEKGENIHKLIDENGNQYDGVFGENGLLRYDEMTNSLKLVYKDGKTYFKMSVVVLQPGLTSFKNNRGEWQSYPGWESLHNLRMQMETNGIHFAAPQSASKMMTLDVSSNDDFSDLQGHLYNNEFFGLQTENPSNKKEITTPTQLLQLIDSEQNDNADVYFQGKTIKVKELKQNYQSYVSQKTSNSYEMAREDIYDIKDFQNDLDEAIAQGKVSPRLAKFQTRAIETLENSGADAQLLDFFSLDENKNPKFDLNLSSTKTKFEQLYLSYFSRGVLSQKNPGYTAALMSGMGIKHLKRATKIVDGKVVAWDFIRREQYDGNYGNVRGESYANTKEEVTEEGQLFLAELEYNAPEYDEEGNITGYFSEMLMPAHYKDFIDGIPLSDNKLPDAISKMFGVRIPSLDKHSFMSLRLVDFLPANLGSTAMFPKEIVALSGADFDIDKEFMSAYAFYVVNDKFGKKEFKKYGDVTTLEGKWEEYKLWMYKSNKLVKNVIKDLTGSDPDFDAKMKEAFVVELLTSKKDVKDKYFEVYLIRALKQLKLPSTIEEFEEASKTREYNNGVLSNRIVDSFIGLLTNTGMHEIAKTPAELTILKNIEKNKELYLKDKDGNPIGESVFSKSEVFPVDSVAGKYNAFRNNTTGKDNIGIDVIANLTYSMFNKGEVELRENHKGFTFDGKEFRSFAGNRQYNLETEEFDGERTNNVLSTHISSATDEAKEQLNAKYNLGVDALKVVNYLIALKVPEETAIYFANQPSIVNYLHIKATKKNNLLTKEEENLSTLRYVEEANNRTEKQIKDFKDFSNKELINLFEKEGMLEVNCD